MCQSGCDIFSDWISNADPIYHSPGCKEALTSRKVISKCLEKILMSKQDWLQFFCNLNSPKISALLSGKLGTEFISP